MGKPVPGEGIIAQERREDARGAIIEVEKLTSTSPVSSSEHRPSDYIYSYGDKTKVTVFIACAARGQKALGEKLEILSDEKP